MAFEEQRKTSATGGGPCSCICFRVLILWPAGCSRFVSVPKFQVSGKNLNKEALREICVAHPSGCFARVACVFNLFKQMDTQ